MMTTITAQKRDMSMKAKKLRREGFVPGSICGKEIKESMMIQIAEKDAKHLIKDCQKGDQVLLTVDGKKFHTIIKDYTYNSISGQIEVLDFQALMKGEKIHTSVEVILKNETLAKGVVTQEMSEIHYKADSDHLLDTIVLDFADMKDVKTLKVSDLEAFKDPEISVTNPDALIFSVKEVKGLADEEEAEEATE